MQITTNISTYSPSGFYCQKVKRCPRLDFEERTKKPFCSLFFPYLETDKSGNILKCEECLLAERRARIKL